MPLIVLRTSNFEGLEQPSFVPSGTYTVEAEGTYNVANYEFVNVLIERSDIRKIVCSEQTTWVLKKDGTLWGCGSGQYGQQGSGSTTDRKTFTQRLTDVKDVACSSNTIWVIKNDNTLWGCGYNYCGQQGSGNTTNVTTFTQRMTDVASISCTIQTTWVIKNDGTLWGCGSNDYGQQGDGYSGSEVYKFVQRLTNVKSVIGSTWTTWALKNDGTLWGCGLSQYGQQGTTELGNVKRFTQRMENVRQFSCSPYDTLAVLNDDTCWECGYSSGSRTFLQKLTGVNYAYLCGTNIFALMKSGDVVNRNGSKMLTDAKHLVCSPNSADRDYYNCWVIKTDDTLWGCGSGAYGQQGSGGTLNVSTFTQRLTGIENVACSSFTTFAVSFKGHLQGCGYNYYGQQGSGNTTNVTTFTQRTLG